MSAYDYDLEKRTNRRVDHAVEIVEYLEKEKNLKIDDNQKAQLIGQLAIATSIESLVVHAPILIKDFVFKFYQEMAKMGVVAAIAKRSEK